MMFAFTDKDYMKLSVSISKAINNAENPVKEKHVRSAILGTFHEKCAETFWAVVLRLPLQDNRIAAWKFCHVLHKILREGHPQSLQDSTRHISRIEDLGKLWGHLRDCYGKLIQEYCNLLIVKINFHRRNPRIPGNLILSSEELEAIGENDVNNYFQLCVEMFDYMDEILKLQHSIFGSLDMSRSNSMTSCGQCRLAPLIPMIQDSSQLYDCCVKLLFKLHASLPQDLLTGHRTRFLEQFTKLSTFYLAASSLQYFKYLIQIPTLPNNPPNFLIQAELGSYVTPVVILPPEEDVSLAGTPDTQSTTGELVDLNSPVTNGNTSPDIIAERDSLIEHLQNELSRCRSEMAKLMSEHRKTIKELNERINYLETDLAKKDNELVQERLLKEELMQHSEDSIKLQEAEKRAKIMEEKFQKIKDIYAQLREEHIQLLRQKAGVDKALKGSDKMTKFARSANNFIIKIKADVDRQLSSLKSLELDTNTKTKLEELANELATLQASADAAAEQKQALEYKLEFVTKEKCHAESELHDLLSQKRELEVNLNTVNNKVKEKEDNLNKQFEKIVGESEEIVKNAIHEVDNPAFSSSTCSIDYLTSLSSGLDSTMSSIDNEITPDVVIRLAHRTAEFVLLGKATSNISPDIEFGERIGEVCKQVGEACLVCLKEIRNGPVSTKDMKEKMMELLSMVSKLQSNLQASSTSVGDLVESELAAMDKAIEEAAKKIEEMLSNSRAADSGIKLEVNEKILDSCTGLMQAIRILVQKSRILQAEIVAQGKGSATAKEFYKRNHQWTEGLISAAKAVGMGATYLLEAADEVVTGGGKIELVMAAAQGISASTAQLVVASRVKAERGSKSLEQLTGASRGVTQATAGVLTNAKACVQLVEQSDDLDVSSLTLHNAKRLEMESQVKVLELENSLAKERLRLSALRRHHYSLASEGEQISPT
ncbi:huntingtin-interacting protein 1 isoform X2 [Cimex lectularius]|uniref:Huntingtin interacting protein n=1 Tax=Cimex lectularius TaxID=79782 RepID=A0A8I6SHS5_CIMLE|nr:huntingtin-interacting protein 1 isoform X2 [Cimex lectularius]